MDHRRVLDEAQELLDRTRAGEEVTDELAAHYETVQALPHSGETSQEIYSVKRVMRLALLAANDRTHIERVIQRVSSGWRYPDIGGPQALLLRDGDPLHTPMPDNPWNIPRSATLDEAITQVWGGLGDVLPRFLRELRRRVLGIALLDAKPYGPVLAYLIYHELDRYEIPEDSWAARWPAYDRRAALAWEPYGDISTIIGHPPAPQPAAPDGVPLPAPLRAFYRVHAGLGNGMWGLTTPDDLMPATLMFNYAEPQPVPTEEPIEHHLSSDLVYFFSYGDDRIDLLDISDNPDDPPVRTWGEGWLYAADYDGLSTFWDWFEENTALFLAFDDD